MRRAGIWLGLGVAGLLGLAVLALAVATVGLNTDLGRRLAEREIARASDGMVLVHGLGGRFPDRLRLGQLELRDTAGAWLEIDDAALDWAPTRLLTGELRVRTLSATHIVMARQPAGSGGSRENSDGVPLRLVLGALRVDRLELAAPVLGQAAVLALEGAGRVGTDLRGEGRLEVTRQDSPAAATLALAWDGAALHATLHGAGRLADLAGLPGLESLRLDATAEGPPAALTTRLDLASGDLTAQAHGTLDLPGRRATLALSAAAPALQLRPDFAWRALALTGTLDGPFATPQARLDLRLDGLAAGDSALERLEVHAEARTTAATLTATADGLALPGAPPELAASLLKLAVEADLAAPDRPVRFTLSHPLAALEGTARTAGLPSVQAHLDLPALAPLAATAGLELAGKAGFDIAAAATAPQGSAMGGTLSMAGTLGLTAGPASLVKLLGPQARLDLAASLDGRALTLSRLSLDGHSLALAAHGARADDGALALEGEARLADLADLAPSLRGDLAAGWRLAGPEDSLAFDAALSGHVAGATREAETMPVQANLHAEGLPGAPSGRLEAGGMLDGAPLDLAATLAREPDGTLRAEIARAAWRSLTAGGHLELAPGATLPQGEITVAMERLTDLSRLLGQKLEGAVALNLKSATEKNEAAATGPVLRLEAGAHGIVAPGEIGLREGRLAATLRDLQGTPRAEARLDLAGLRAGGLGGTARLDAAGPPEALELKLAAALTGVGGAPLEVHTEARLDLPKRVLALSAATALWKDQTLRLLGPARLEFAEGMRVDRLHLGLGGATLAVGGQFAPRLDATATLRGVEGSLARAFVPDLALEGQLEADARLGGTLGEPTGTLRLAAGGVRISEGPAAGLPPARLDARAELSGRAARLQAQLTAGTSQVAVSGRVPLPGSGGMNLTVEGNLDLALFDPLLAAGGRRVRGGARLAAQVSGPLAAPRLAGTLTLSGGEVQDFALGLRLDDIAGELSADGTTLRLVRLTARAGKGNLSATGTLGLTGAMPLDLTLAAKNASPLASDQLSAVIDGNVTARGDLLGEMLVSGTLRVPRADIRVPERLPASVATLKVRRPGAPVPATPAASAAPAPDIRLDLTLVSPGQIFLRGRGLDAELAGRLRIAGTVAEPRPAGGFTLRRGQFSIAGTSLDFTRGRVGFDGSGKIDPTLDFLASSTSGTTTANLAITGYASAPKITLSSSPEMPQDEVLAWLLFHQSSASLSPLQLAQIAGAVAQITGVSGGFDPLETLRSGLGLDRLSVGNNASGSGSRVEAGRYVAKGVYVGARQSTSGGSSPQAVVQIDLARGLKLEATAGQPSEGATGSQGSEGGSSVGITYQFEY